MLMATERRRAEARNVEHGIGATHRLDHGVAWTQADMGRVAKKHAKVRREQPPERTEADVLAEQEAARESVAAQADPETIQQVGPWGDQEIGKIIRMYRAGCLLEDIAADVGESPSTVTAEIAAIKEDLVARSSGRVMSGGTPASGKRLNDDQVEAILRMRSGGARTSVIARQMGVSESTVRYVIQRAESH